MLKNIQSTIQRSQWERKMRSSSDEFLAQALSNFKRWREVPDGDNSLSPDELDKRIAFLDKRIAFLKSLIASRK